MGLGEQSIRQAEKQEKSESQSAQVGTVEDFQEFLYIVSHDLQEPLRMVIGFMDLLERRYGNHLDKDAQDFIQYAVGGAHRMQKMIDGLLVLSRITTQGKGLIRADSNKALQHAINILHATIDHSSAELVLSKLPEVNADESQLTVLFGNLLDNALRYRDADRIPRIEITADMHGAEWHFKISDNGIGIARKHWHRVFQVFQQVNKGPDNACQGMGLPVCKRIVERHGGRIWLESELGVGSEVCFTLPVRELN